MSFALENSNGAYLESGGSILIHDGADVYYQIGGGNGVPAIGAGTLGTVVAHELHNSHNGAPGKWLRLMIGEGGMKYYRKGQEDKAIQVLFSESEGVYEAWINMEIENLEDQLFPDVEDPKQKNPADCGCSVVGENGKSSRPGLLALSTLFLLGLAAWRRKYAVKSIA